MNLFYMKKKNNINYNFKIFFRTLNFDMKILYSLFKYSYNTHKLVWFIRFQI